MAEAQTPIAIVGLDCRLPGAEDPTAYWNLLESGRAALGELPPDRLDRGLYYAPEKGTQGKTYATIGGIVPDRPVHVADLGLSGTAFEHTDTAFLAICDVAARALRNAGLEPFHLPHRHAGVYLGSTGGTRHSTDWIFATLIEETAGYLRDLPAFRDNSSTLGKRQLDRLVDTIVREVRRKYGWRNDIPSPNLSAHVAAHAISRAFNLTGPSMALDAACASSLQAMALGVQALRLGTIDMAIVGGASCLKQHSLVLFSAAQSLTASDSRPFDAGADGLVAAEGYVALVLKRLADAVADGDPIRGVIRDIASASDGKGKSLWAPRKEGQILAMQRVYQRGIDVRDLQYIEAHATSTQVGDATELTALAEALGPHLAPGQRIALGASKGNIGHTLETAGIAGVAKVLLALERRTIPPVAGVRQPNPKVDWVRLPFYLPFQPEPWPELPGRSRLASVNSFGIGGLNTHVVLEEYRAESRQRHFATATPRPIASMVHRPELDPTSRSTSGAGSVPTIGSDPAIGSVLGEQRLPTAFAPIAIVGMGAILPGAFTVKSLSELIETGNDARRGPPEGRWSSAALRAWPSLTGDSDQSIIGGFLDGYQYDWRKNKVPPKQVAQGNPLQFLLLDATSEALRSAGYDSRPWDRQRTAVVVGSIFRGDFCDQLQMGLRLPEFHSHLLPHLEALGWDRARIDVALAAYDERLLERMPALLDETGSFTASTLASRITKAFDLMGGAVAIDAGEASGMAAMTVGIDQLRRGDCEMVICAGANQSLDFCAFQAIVSRGKRFPCNNDARPRPFGEHAFASPPGEGVAVVILKPLAAAERDGDPVFAVIRGLGVATDPEHPSRAAELAIRTGLQAARLTPSEIDALETDGSDGEHEMADVDAIAKVFETSPPRARPLPLRSLAGQIGQCGAAMGNAGLIAATLQLAQRQLFPGPKVVEHAAHLRRHERTLCPLDESLALPCEVPPGESHGTPKAKARIGVLAGIASGSSYFAILETGNMSITNRHKAPPSASVVAAASSNQTTSEAPAPMVGHAKTMASSTRAVTRPHSPPNMVISANPTSKTRPPERNSVNAASPPSRIVWLFPGQGSQYPEMLKSLAAECQPVAAAIAEADAVLRAMGLETFTRIAWEESRDLGADLWRTQLAMLVADYAMARALTSLGAQPDLVAGHSFGELAALVAANCWSLEDAIRGTWERADAQRRSVREPAGLMAIFASRDRVESLIAWSEQPVFIANHNAPEQVIVGGSRVALEQFAAVATSHRINTSILPVPSAFHTPLMADAVQPFAAGLSKLTLRPGDVPVISTATNRAMIDPADYRDSLVASLTLPVRYVDLIHRLDSEQPTLFIEVGPQRVLTKLNQKILGSDRVHTLPTDEPKGKAFEQLRQAANACVAIADSRSASSRMFGPRATGLSIASRAAPAPGRLLHFDATERRRDARRRTGSHNNSPDEVTVTATSPVTAPPVARVSETSPPVAKPPVATRPLATPSAIPPRVKTSATPSADLSADSLRSFLLRFVVDQTGYPEEMIELDSNLEADLGIDSIKKAQLFGEIAEQFQVAPPSGPVTLDDYPTLRHVFDYLIAATGAAPAREESPREESPSAIPLETLRSFLLRFVVEQTGYPEEMVELDSNLEADLGIDSIKKAQLFGEIAEQFQVAP
ncbi:MAG: beta-ketoacyl synthase N-terminal-like domain-containing protein, partial [Planctomycetota bacterium]